MGFFDLFRRRRPGRLRATTVAQGGPPAGFAVLDVETTGLSAGRHRVLEVAVVRTDPWGRVLGEWVQRLNPDGPVGASHVHGITDVDVAHAPRFGDVLPQLNHWLAGTAVVAHNAAFDLAFLRAEYAYQGWALPWLPALCTLEASDHYLPGLDRRRLGDCCSAARIRHHGAHSALGDARATAALLAYYLSPRTGVTPRPADLDLLHQAGSVRWPTGPTRRPRTPDAHAVVRSRIRAAPPTVATPGLLELLRDFSLTDALDEGARPGSLPYLEKLAEALEDGELTEDEIAVLGELAAAYQLPAEDRAAADRALLLALCHLALDDGCVTRAERAELRSMATLLGLPDRVVTDALDHAEAARHARLGAGLQPLPAGWPHGEPLRVGDKVVFTGCDEQVRRRLEVRAEELGVRVLSTVSRRTALLVTDGGFVGTKAEVAARLGTRCVHPDTFGVLLRHLQPAPPRRTVAPTTTTTEPGIPRAGASVPDVPRGPDPAVVRSWAGAHGYQVGDRGRLPGEVVAAYNAARTR